MELPEVVYQALEDIVGPANISRDPAMLDSYAFQYMAEACNKDLSKFMPRPIAVILPASTEEVQAVVRTCNRYRIKLHALSNGWGAWGAAQTEDAIQMDMRRMNHILEIDQKNMYAVVEPSVIAAQLQAEAMKVGLNVHMIGAGAGCSVLANHAAYGGPGPDSIFMGNGPENLLAVEWVMPDGEILRTGSLGSGLGWFYSEGPGPSTRGLSRGPTGHWGGLGVLTKCSLKLHPWPGPPTIPVEGKGSIYKAPLMNQVRSYTVAFPDLKSYCEFHYKLYDSEIGYIAHRQFLQWGDELQAAVIKIVTDPTKQMCDIEELLKDPDVQKLTKEMENSFQLIIAGMTARDIEFQEKALDQMLEETGGWKVAWLSEAEMEKWTLMYMTRMGYKNMNWIFAGCFTDTMIASGTPDMLFTSGLNDAARKILANPTDGIVNTGSDTGMGAVDRGADAGIVGIEPFLFYDPYDRDSTFKARKVMADGRAFTRQPWDVITFSATSSLCRPNVSQEMINGQTVFHWQRKIKEVFDPYGLGDGSYMTADALEKK